MMKRWRFVAAVSVVSFWISLFCAGATRADLTDGLIGYWPLDDLDATDATDNGLDGDILGDIDVVEDRFGNPDGAMYFPGLSDSYIDLGDQDEFRITGAMTLAGWVNLDSINTENGRIIAKRGGRGNRSWSLNIEYDCCDSAATFQISSDGSESFIVNDTESLPMDEWAHVTGVFRPGESVELYVNAELREFLDVGIPDEQFSDNGLPVRIGARNGCCYWHGAIDDVAMWGRDLSAEEIMTLFESGIGGGASLGDFDGSGVLDLADVNALSAEIAGGAGNLGFDVNSDKKVDSSDLTTWVKDLRKTWFGDANLDGEFNSTDLVNVFQFGQYNLDTEVGWDQGDWTADRRFDSGDLVMAFQDSGYDMGPLPAVSAVPEPSGVALLVIGLAGLMACSGSAESARKNRWTSALAKYQRSVDDLP